jgi:ABC-2 type transport system permease protein
MSSAHHTGSAPGTGLRPGVLAALLAGLQRARIELRQQLTSAQDVWQALFFPVLSLIVMYVLRDSRVPGTDFSLGTQSVPGILGMNVVLGALTGLAITLTMDREDGTLLRAKATPNGVVGYLTGRLLSRAGMTVLSLLVPLIPAAFLFDGLESGSVRGWLTLAWVLALGLLAVLPWGAVAGSSFASAQSMSVVTLPTMLLTVISGVFYPVGAFPDWLQWIAQVFPIYWLGLGLRSALLPAELSAAEIDGSWRHLETAGALGAWALAGLVVAPFVLRRMARRESGASLAVRREKALQRPV